MTPEDDVNKDTDQELTENSDADRPEQADDTPKKADSVDASAESKTDSAPESQSDKTPTDFADKAADALRELNSGKHDKDDIERAASAQEQSAGATAADSEASDNDPLGFLDKNADGEVENPDDEAASLRSQLDDASAKVKAQQEQLLRIQAEMENQRKRAQNDVTKAHKFALEKIALDLLPVKDSLEMGLQAATGEDAEPSKIIEGSELTLKMLAQALEKYNIVEINPVDEKFDPEFHQAMSMQPVEGKESNTVASVMQKGYTLNERLIRPALVMVAK